MLIEYQNGKKIHKNERIRNGRKKHSMAQKKCYWKFNDSNNLLKHSNKYNYNHQQICHNALMVLQSIRII